jgi:hypothetical protein
MLRVSPSARYSEFIQVKPAGNLYHGVRLAAAIGYPLNLFVSINFTHTECSPKSVSAQFKRLRDTFGKWVTRPPKGQAKASPTFIWVVENPSHINVHWLVHVPKSRHDDFRERLPVWLRDVAGDITDESAIHVRSAYNPNGARLYMMKGTHPAVAPFYGVQPEPQGWVHGKRSGFSRNIGPTQKRRMRAAGAYPKAARRVFAPAHNWSGI